MIQNLPNSVLLALPDDVRARATRVTFASLVAQWRGAAGSGGAGAANAGVLAASQADSVASIQTDGTYHFVAVQGNMVATNVADVLQPTTPIMVTDLSVVAQESLITAPCYASLLFNIGAGTNELGNWPVGLYIPPKGMLNTKLSNLEAAAHNVIVTYWGYRIYT